MLPKNVNLCSELFRVGFPSKTCYLCGKKGWYTKVVPQTLVLILEKKLNINIGVININRKLGKVSF